MRRLLTLLAVPAALAVAVLTAGSASASSVHANVTVDLGPAVCIPGELFITGDAHANISPDGNIITEQIQGTASTVDLGTGTVLATGHGEAWFGMNKNHPLGHDTLNAQIGGVKIHMAGQFTVNANGDITAARQTVTCG